MAKYTKSEIKRKLDELKDVFEHLVEEQTEEISNFITKEIIPNAPGMAEFMKHINPIEHPHPKYGPNPHPLTCGRCGRSTPIVLPLGKINAVWSCKPCGTEQYNVEDEFIKCPSCKQLMTQEKVFGREDPVSFDYHCKVCRENEESQTQIATSGGALVVCPQCRTTGTLPSTDKQVIRFREEKGISATSEVRFLLSETQCPRCADMRVQRVFSLDESNRIFLHEADREEGFFKETSENVLTKGVKKNVKKHEKPADLVGNPRRPKVNEVSPSKKEVLFTHPGTKSSN